MQRARSRIWATHVDAHSCHECCVQHSLSEVASCDRREVTQGFEPANWCLLPHGPQCWLAYGRSTPACRAQFSRTTMPRMRVIFDMYVHWKDPCQHRHNTDRPNRRMAVQTSKQCSCCDSQDTTCASQHYRTGTISFNSNRK